jgi:hypothetical protein
MWISLFEELTDLSIQQARYESVKRTIDAHAAGAPPLVELSGMQFQPSNAGDDLGIFFFIPNLAELFGLSAAEAINAFFFAIVGLGYLGWVIGCMAWMPTWPRRVASALSLFWAYYYLRPGEIRGVWEVYTVSPALVMAVVPGFLALLRHKGPALMVGIFVAVVGVLTGLAHQLRVHSGTPILLFVGVCLLAQVRWNRRVRIGLVAVLLLGTAMPRAWFGRMADERDLFLHANVPGYQPPATRSHAFWHAIYLGLSVLGGRHGIEWSDASAAKRVHEIDPEAPYLSARYESALKSEVLRIAREDKHFFITTFFAKLGIIAYFIILFANLGLLIAYRFRKPAWLDAAAWCAIAFSALPGLLTIPILIYVSGLIAWGPLYALMSLDHALERGRTSGPRGVTVSGQQLE